MDKKMDGLVPFTGLASLPADAYFIRLTDIEDHYLHVEKQTGDEVHYRVGKGPKGAAIFTRSNAKRFIKSQGWGNAEAIEVRKVLPPDGTEN